LWANDGSLRTIRFGKRTEARFIKLVARSEVQDRSYTSVAELDVLLE